jgi:serine/threonine protein kinase/tetratricopeptide (TPR) repeat protein
MTRESDPSTAFVMGHKLGPYELLKPLGAGGMGVVFQARDTERNTVVALKTLQKLNPAMLLRLKNEFRGMANVAHPNLVTLYEMMRVGDVWFFTMEYVEGRSLLQLMRRAGTMPSPVPVASTEEETASILPEAPRPATPVVDATETISGLAATAPALSTGTQQPVHGSLLQMGDLRRILRELAVGISALHRTGLIHRDIKPANIMVAQDGRVVLLDFGLSSPGGVDTNLAGTPAYISPELLCGEPVTEASDWYSMGVMIYELLSGHRPFSSNDSLGERAFREVPPLPASELIPEDLRQLCMALLQRNPKARPRGNEIIERLSGSSLEALTVQHSAQESQALALIGRQAELDVLWKAYHTLRSGHGVTLHVYGRSGIGKTALLQHYLSQLKLQHHAVVISGRCYERESVPYKAFDALIDALISHLQILPQRVLQGLLADLMVDLTRIFPVLRQLPVSPESQEALPQELDTAALRRHAFRAFKQLLARLARRGLLVLHLDDLQWGDTDSFALLNELVSPPNAPELLLLCSFRSDEGSSAALLAEHRRIQRTLRELVDIRELEVGPLSVQSASQLAASLLGLPLTDSQVAKIAGESQGNPLFVEELVRHAASVRPEESSSKETALTLDRVILSRVGRLPQDSQRVLELVAVAGRRIAQGFAIKAAQVEGNVYQLWATLRTQYLVRTWGPRDRDPVECYHDQIRETVHNYLEPDQQKQLHAQLAKCLESMGVDEPEELARHYLKAGVWDKAAHYLILAGDRAAATMAFESAARMYGYALECLPGERSLMLKRADALVNAGRCSEAAALYLAAAERALPDECFDLRRKACEQLLASGQNGEALTLLKLLLAEVGLRFPSTRFHLVASILRGHVALRLRGSSFEERAEEQVPPRQLAVIDLTLIAGKGLGALDLMLGSYFSLLSTQLALNAGEPRRIARSLANLSMVDYALGSAASVARGDLQMEKSEEIARRFQDSRLSGFNLFVRGTKVGVGGHWEAAGKLFSEALQIFEEKCIGMEWERSLTRANYVPLLIFQGRYKEAAVLCSRWLRHTEEIGDLYGGLWMRLWSTSTLMASDDLQGAERSLSEANELLARYSQSFTFIHQISGQLGCELALYGGNASRGLACIEEVWKRARLLINISGGSFAHCHMLRGLLRLAVARERPAEQAPWLGLAEKDGRALMHGKKKFLYCEPAGALILAGVAHARGQRARALELLDVAITGFESSDMMVRAHCARRRKGELLGGAEGQALIQTAEAEMKERGVHNVERMLATFAPGF